MFCGLKESVLELFGIEEFTKEQEESIKSVLDGHDVFVTLPLEVENL